MARPPRIEFEGALYHLTSRGNGRQVIFHSDADRRRFLDQLQDNLETYGVVLYAFVLMPNHYHLLVRTRRANLARFAQRLNTSYGLYYRYKHHKPGHVFQGRYHAKLVGGNEYLLALTRYLHLNPVKTREMEALSARERVERLESYPWSSYPGYVSAKVARRWVDYEPLRAYGRSWASARRRYRAYVHAMVMRNDAPLRELMERSPQAVGGEAFVAETEAKLLQRRKGDGTDRDVQWPRCRVELEEIDRWVAAEYGVKPELLKAHGRAVGEAKAAAVELAVRLSGLTQRQVGEHYGGISSSAVAMIRGRLRVAAPALRGRLMRLLCKGDSGLPSDRR